MVRIYTDGSSVAKTGMGGWAWVSEDGRAASGTVYPATNNQMELQAAIEAVAANSGKITIISDSKYLVDCFRQGWWKRWETRNYKNVANPEQWKILVVLWKLDRFDVGWTRGHDGHKYNSMADKLAGRASHPVIA